MNFDLADKLSELLESQKLDEAINLAEQELNEIPTTDLHKILNRNLLHLTSDLTKFINDFDNSTQEVLKKKQGFLKKPIRIWKTSNTCSILL